MITNKQMGIIFSIVFIVFSILTYCIYYEYTNLYYNYELISKILIGIVIVLLIVRIIIAKYLRIKTTFITPKLTVPKVFKDQYNQYQTNIYLNPIFIGVILSIVAIFMNFILISQGLGNNALEFNVIVYVMVYLSRYLLFFIILSSLFELWLQYKNELHNKEESKLLYNNESVKTIYKDFRTLNSLEFSKKISENNELKYQLNQFVIMYFYFISTNFSKSNPEINLIYSKIYKDKLNSPQENTVKKEDTNLLEKLDTNFINQYKKYFRILILLDKLENLINTKDYSIVTYQKLIQTLDKEVSTLYET